MTDVQIDTLDLTEYAGLALKPPDTGTTWEDWDQDDGDWPEWCDCYGLPYTSTPEQVHEAVANDYSNTVVIGSLEALTELRDAWIEELQDA